MITTRITKYCPTLRSPDGAYRVEDWTSVSDIGRSFLGQELTVDQYLSVESAYVSAVQYAMQRCQIASLNISDSGPGARFDHLPRQLRDVTHAIHQPISDGKTVAGDELEAIVRLILREVFWCKLEGNHRFYVHFGWDFYMYVGYERDEPMPSELNGLFIENVLSPYAD